MRFDQYLNRQASILEKCYNQDFVASINQLANSIVRCLRANNKILVAGNGGSAADAQHFAAELVGRYKVDRKALPAIAMTTDTSILTALSNDFGYASVFTRQLEALANHGDLFIGISTSGKSPSILNALDICEDLQVQSFMLTSEKCDLQSGNIIKVPSHETNHIQELHISIIHFICELVDENFN
jgi:D-sedoheptulose 7-phosphate isomerase